MNHDEFVRHINLMKEEDKEKLLFIIMETIIEEQKGKQVRDITLRKPKDLRDV